jgi:hypothetical protein
MFKNPFFGNRTFYEVMWKNLVHSDIAQMTVWRILIACWTPKPTNTHSEYVITIFFFTETMVTRPRYNVLYVRCLFSFSAILHPVWGLSE